MEKITFLDCTLRDGGYYNAWDFSADLIKDYLYAMKSIGVDAVELGFRTLKKDGFQGPCAFTTDSFISSLDIPKGVQIGVMVNGSELVGDIPQEEVLQCLFPKAAENSPVDLVRIACHVHEFEHALPAVNWLKDKGYKVGFNLMQVADRSENEVKELASLASKYPMDVLYFADSMGSMSPAKVAEVIAWFRSEWKGAMGIHTHDNLGLGLSNTLRAMDEGVTWVDSTVTGMGRGPGNARTEELAIEISDRRKLQANIAPLMSIIEKYFKPMQINYGWGTNPYYYLAGKYGIHPTYIQEMLGDSRYSSEDVLSVIDYLRKDGGKKFSHNTLQSARLFYTSEIKEGISLQKIFSGKEVLLIGSGAGAARHRDALERYIKENKPVVLALNTQKTIQSELIDFRIASHPVRLLADCEVHKNLSQPLIAPFSMLPENIQKSLTNKQIFDFGLKIQSGVFEFFDSYCTIPAPLVVAYALAAATSGKAKRVLMAGFDGYGADDPRTQEMQTLFECYQQTAGSLPLTAITPTRYGIHTESVYAL